MASTSEAGPSSGSGSASGSKSSAADQKAVAKMTATKKKNAVVYQFKVTLRGAKPPIWRRIQVPGDYNFAQLHKVINLAMGWRGYHLHSFETQDKTNIGTPDPEEDYLDFSFRERNRVFDEKVELIVHHFTMSPGHKRATYIYDFGNDWNHSILLEKICPVLKDKKYPICIAGKRACPPEDVGGIDGYEEFLKALANPKDSEHKEQKEWAISQVFKIGKEADFNPSDVDFAEIACDDLLKEAESE